ncbi:MAG: sulfatase-like hydrolase/transferase, partial [Bacteroidota bacterium]|nr:sulfatase-like hydrolase/transferase [Bacteroidota bacterium]
MREYTDKIVLLIKRILLLLLAFQLVRLFFFIVNYNFFSDEQAVEILSIFFYGTRFDYATIVYYNGLFLLISILPFSFTQIRSWQTVLKTLYVSINSFLLFADMGDAVYFGFSNKRTTADFFSSTGQVTDLILLLPKYLSDFWFVPLCAILILAILIFLYPKAKNSNKPNIRIKPGGILQRVSVWAIFLITATMIYFFARGFNLKPVRIITASEYVEAKNIPLVLNTGFSLITTISSDVLPVYNFFESVELEKIYPVTKDYSANSEFRKLNVIIIILESFGKEYIGSFNNNKGYTPFLETMLDKGTNCTNAFANGRRSMEALPAIISGIPALTLSPFITSQFASNEISGIPALLKRKGYHTSFFHGGRTGTMGFDYFTRLAGIDNYFGKEDYPYEEGFDGNWGIFDEEYFSYFNSMVSSFPEPFFSCFFSLSSHHPYKVPPKYENKFDEGTLEIHKSVQYADFALKKFFEAAQKESWYKNTIFVITADHTSQTKEKKYQTRSGAYQIPLLFFQPGDSTMQ